MKAEAQLERLASAAMHVDAQERRVVRREAAAPFLLDPRVDGRVLLFDRRVTFLPGIEPGSDVTMGSAIGTL